MTVPHSWPASNWPPSVYPGTSSKARYVLRAHRSELLQSGALARVGRELVVIGPKYSRWLERRAANVPAFECNANKAAP